MVGILSARAPELTFRVGNAADNYTRFSKDSIPVKLASGAVGMVVAHQCMPVTDKIVDKAADFIAEKRAKRSAKKNTKKED
jgi:hypothetical protein